jgi:hypothetical protein
MKTVPIGPSGQRQQLAYGCWRIADQPGPGENGALGADSGVLAAFESAIPCSTSLTSTGTCNAERVFGRC